LFDAWLVAGQSEGLVRFAETALPTIWGEFRLRIYADRQTGREHIALFRGEVRGKNGVLVRVHSECFTGEVLGSLKCDCKEQLEDALRRVADQDGIVVYLRQEGRGIGLGNKVRAYRLQSQGADTIEANELLGFSPDSRSYGEAAEILRDLGVGSIRLITNNPDKITGLRAGGIDVVERIASPSTVQRHNRCYLETKLVRMGHLPAAAPFSGCPSRTESDRK